MPHRNVFASAFLFISLVLTTAACEECSRTEPEEVDWELTSMYQRGSVALADGSFQIAEQEFRKVLSKDSGHVGAYTKLAMALEGRAVLEPALADSLLGNALDLLQKALKYEPENKVVWSETARLARKAGQPQRAIAAWEKLLSLDPSQVKALLVIAEIREESEDLAGAEKTLRKALEGDEGPAALALGRFLLRLEKADEARKLLQGIVACPKPKGDLTKPPPCPTAAYFEAQDELGSLAVRQGRLPDARKIYHGLVRMFPEDYMAWEVLAALDERDGIWAAAEQKYRQSLALDRVHMSVWRGLGRSLAAQKRLDDALFAYRKADNFLAKNPEQALEMADELVALGEIDWARSLLERARILVSEDAELHSRLGQKLKKLDSGDGKEAPTPKDSGSQGK